MAERHASAGTGAGSRTEQREQLVITRVFDAPRDLVWQAWTAREHAVQWWGPKGFTARILEWADHPGGAWRAVMRSPTGEEYPQHGVMKELTPPEHLAFTLIWDHDGPASEMLVSVTLTARGDKTEMVFRKGPFRSEPQRQGEEGGWNEAFDRLEAHVTAMR
jgi:uncharacterized protein YndB with AHSA1/START domain